MVTAGSLVKGGFYFNRDQWDLVAVGGKEGVLPGSPGQRCRPVPTWAVVLLAPLLGAVFVFLLPLVGLGLAGRYLGRGLLKGLRAAGRPGAAPP
jgi:hypothetical protein